MLLVKQRSHYIIEPLDVHFCFLFIFLDSLVFKFYRVLVTGRCVPKPIFVPITWEILIDIVGYLSDDSKFFLQGFAAGLMLSISFLDLAHNAINSIGFLKGNLWVSTSVSILCLTAFFFFTFPSRGKWYSFLVVQFFGGVIFFACIAKFIPEPTLGPSTDVKRRKARLQCSSKTFCSELCDYMVSWQLYLFVDNRRMETREVRTWQRSIDGKCYIVELLQLLVYQLSLPFLSFVKASLVRVLVIGSIIVWSVIWWLDVSTMTPRNHCINVDLRIWTLRL